MTEGSKIESTDSYEAHKMPGFSLESMNYDF